MRYFVHLAYKGTAYRGWQRQKQTSETIQELLELNFSQMLKEKVTLFGCGRTDAGVHASQYFLHFNFSDDFTFDPVVRLNKMLPLDIRILDFIEVHNSAHAQHDATSRTYTYHIHFKENPFKADFSTLVDANQLDLEKLSQAVALIGSQSDFRSMCKKPNQYHSTECNVHQFKIAHHNEGLSFTIEANRFLQSMVRLLIGRVLDVASSKLTLEELQQCFVTGEPPKFPNAAYPQGLFLAEIKYQYLKRTPITRQF